MAERKRCTYCGKLILLVETENGARMPIDPDPDPTGNVVIRTLTTESGLRLNAQVAHVLKRDEVPPEDMPRHTTHFATCAKYPRKDGSRPAAPRQDAADWSTFCRLLPAAIRVETSSQALLVATAAIEAKKLFAVRELPQGGFEVRARDAVFLERERLRFVEQPEEGRRS